MARLVKLHTQIQLVKQEYFARNRTAEEHRERETRAAVRLQSCFRGCRARAYLSHLHQKATVIQRVWRGFSARTLYRQTLKEAYFTMKMNFYNQMAVRIQRRWRGFYVRRYVHNFYARKRYLEGLARKNLLVRRDLEEVAQCVQRQRERAAAEREEQQKNIQAQRTHFLLSTQQCPGVYNSPFRSAPDEMELRLRRAKPRPTRPSPRNRAPLLGGPCAAAPFFPGAPGVPHGFTSRPLPPIPSKKPQGPFRAPVEVWEQRLRGAEPSLRVQTSVQDLENAQNQLYREDWASRGEAAFLPFSRAHQDRKYVGMLHTASCFQPPAYGTKHFREERPEQLTGKEPFKTVFTTCHVFDRFGRLYSNAGKIV